jgi:ribose transport system ATP-binding protein
MENVLQMQGIVKDFPGVRALDHVDFDLRSGEIHALVGENGAGKSTLIKILTGIYERDAGSIQIRNQPINNCTPRDMQKLGVACIYQELNLIPNFDVARNIYLGSEPVNKSGMVSWSQMYSQADKTVQSLGVTIDIRTPIRKLGIGQRQMVIIARALLHQPAIFILDEPTAMLTRAEIHYLFQLLRRLKEQNVGILYISHRMEEVFEIADRITVMRDGLNVGTLEANQTEADEIVALMVGRKLDDLYPKQSISFGKTLLEAQHLCDNQVVNDVSLHVRESEALGIYGVIGSGTTELGQILAGDRKATQGEVAVEGRRASLRSPNDALKSGIALIPKDRREEGLILSFTVKENMTLSSLRYLNHLGLLDFKNEESTAQEQIASLSIRTYGSNQLVRELSGGNQQKVEIAKALLSRAWVFVFDEPTRGVDVGAKSEIYRLMGKLLENKAAIIFFSSELPEILHIADRVMVMYRGRVVLEKPTSETDADEILLYALKGEGSNENGV